MDPSSSRRLVPNINNCKGVKRSKRVLTAFIGKQHKPKLVIIYEYPIDR